MSTKNANVDFERYLRRDWLSGRAEQIHEQMSSVFRKFIAEEAPKRAQQLVNAVEDVPLVPGMSPKDQVATHFMMGYSQALAEGVLVAVALGIALQESKAPPPDH